MILSREQAQHIAAQITTSVEFFGETFGQCEWSIAFPRPEGTIVTVDLEQLGVLYIEEFTDDGAVQTSVAPQERHDTFADFICNYKL
jgi:hypothetical protein